MSKTPKALACYLSLGVKLGPVSGTNWRGDCPLCGKERHFFANPENGLFDCKSCGAKGNAVSFLGQFAEAAHKSVTRRDWVALSRKRGIPSGLLKAEKFGLFEGMWYLPIPGATGTIRDVRRWDSGRLQSTKDCKLQLFGIHKLTSAPPGSTVFLMEGEWDKCAMEWILRDSAQDAIVVAVPGASVFKDEWADAMRGMKVVTFYDNDEPGDKGQLRAEGALRGVAADLRHVCWPDAGLPDGWDVRDHAKTRIPEVGARKALDELLELARERTRLRASGDGSNTTKLQATRWTDSELPDASLEDVEKCFGRFLSMNEEMRVALRLMLAVCLSNDIKDDPLWLYVIGQPSSGKTELLSQLQESIRCVFVSSVTPHGLVSGWRGEGDRDPSLIPKLGGKTLVVKDFTEILAMPDVAQAELYSILRGAYDGYVDRVYGNGIVRKFHGCHFSILAGSTQAIHKTRNSSLGERFLKFEMKTPTRSELVARSRTRRGSLGRKNESSDEIKKTVAGYLKRKIEADSLPPDGKAGERIEALSELVAILRADVPRDRFTGEITHRSNPEAWTRLSLQLSQLARILAFMGDRAEVGNSEMEVVTRVALDTAGGLGTEIVLALLAVGGKGTKRTMSDATHLPTMTLSRRVDDLVVLNVLEIDSEKSIQPGGGRPSAVYRVSKEVRELWTIITGGDDSWTGKQWQARTNRRFHRKEPLSSKRRTFRRARKSSPE